MVVNNISGSLSTANVLAFYKLLMSIFANSVSQNSSSIFTCLFVCVCSSVTFLFLQTLSSRNLSHSNISQFKFRIRTDYFGLVVIKRRKCFRLKKQITNDRSAPLVTGVNLLWIGELVNRRCRIKHCNALVEKLGNWCHWCRQWCHFQPSSDTLGIISKMSNSNDNNCWIKIKK